MELDRDWGRMLRRHALHACHHYVVLVLGGGHLSLVSLLGLLGLVSRLSRLSRVSRRLGVLGCRTWDSTRGTASASARQRRRPCSRGRG